MVSCRFSLKPTHWMTGEIRDHFNGRVQRSCVICSDFVLFCCRWLWDCPKIPSGNSTYRKSPCSMGKSTINGHLWLPSTSRPCIKLTTSMWPCRWWRPRRPFGLKPTSSMIRYWSFFSVHSFVPVAAIFWPELKSRLPSNLVPCKTLRFSYMFCWLLIIE